MIRAIHIEDEPANIALVKNLLETHCADKVELVGNAGNLKDAFDLIKVLEPELVYLDIELNQGNAFDLLKQLQDSIGIDFEIIFITAFNNYAIKAFRQNAVDYILKPISIKELKEATQRAFDKIKNNQYSKNIIDLLHDIKQKSLHNKIGLPVTDGLYFVNMDEIIKIEALGGGTNIFLVNNRKVACTKTLKEIETLLPGSPKFMRVHNAWIINSMHLRKYYKGKNSYMEMEDDSTVPVSIRKKGDFLDRL